MINHGREGQNEDTFIASAIWCRGPGELSVDFHGLSPALAPSPSNRLLIDFARVLQATAYVVAPA